VGGCACLGCCHLLLGQGLAACYAKQCPAQHGLLCCFCSAQQHLRELTASNAYNVLHLRVEESWPQECERWERSQYGAGCNQWRIAAGSAVHAWHISTSPSPVLHLSCAIPAGRVLDNCLNNTSKIGESLLAHGINSQVSKRLPTTGRWKASEETAMCNGSNPRTAHTA